MSDITSGTKNQDELPNIRTALELEKLDPILFRSTSLWFPRGSRGVFGGHVISQALVAATNCVDKTFSLHSLHCYFVLGASAAVPILYHVERIRDGRSYVTRSVKAVQNGRVIFVLLASFQKPEPWQPSYQVPPPPQVPSPEECMPLEDQMAGIAASPESSERVRRVMRNISDERRKSNIEIRGIPQPDGQHVMTIQGMWDSKRLDQDGKPVYMWWMRAKDLQHCDAPMQKCILGYMSDLQFVNATATVLGLERLSRGPNALAMISSLDHSIWYYNEDFNCGDWLLYVVTVPRIASGRGVVHGRMYTREGTLIATMAQEGVVRADRKDPSITSKL